MKCGDVNTALIRTTQGKSIMLQFDTHTGRPYSAWTNCAAQAPHTTAILRAAPRSRSDLGLAPLARRRSLRKGSSGIRPSALGEPQEGITANQQGHGGMDFVMMFRLIRCLNEGVALDLSVYDGALWSLVGVLVNARWLMAIRGWTFLM